MAPSESSRDGEIKTTAVVNLFDSCDCFVLVDSIQGALRACKLLGMTLMTV